MKKIKSLAIICLLITSLTVPTSALAASGYNYSQQNSFDAFLDSIFSFFIGDKDWDWILLLELELGGGGKNTA